MATKNGRWWLTHDSCEIVIESTPEHIYDLVAELPRMGEWSPECQSVEWVDGARAPPSAPGSSATTGAVPAASFKWSRRGRVLVADPGREFAFVTEEGGRESTEWRYRFEPVDGGTRVTESYEVRWIPAWARIVDVPTNRHRELREAMRHTLGQLKTAAESKSRSRPADEPRPGVGAYVLEADEGETLWFAGCARHLQGDRRPDRSAA